MRRFGTFGAPFSTFLHLLGTGEGRVAAVRWTAQTTLRQRCAVGQLHRGCCVETTQVRGIVHRHTRDSCPGRGSRGSVGGRLEPLSSSADRRISGAKREKRPGCSKTPWEPRLIARRLSSPARIGAWG